jgi:uncharacterized protein YdhG (YjbR/CyaY superfamily)
MPTRSAKSTRTADADARVQVRAYFAKLEPDARRHLRRLRDIIRETAPDAAEAFSYRIPAFKVDGRPLVWYAAWKGHVSMYPITPALRRKHRVDVGDHEVATGTIRFPLARPIPVTLVRRLVKARLTEARSE